MFILLILFFVILCLLVIYDIIIKCGYRWRLLVKFPGDYALPFIGNALQLGLDSDKMTNRLFDMWHKHGKKNFRVAVGSENWVMLCEPQDVRVILSHPTELSKPHDRNQAMLPFFGNSVSTSEGERWRSIRKLINSNLHVKTMELRVDIVNTYCENLIHIFEDEKGKGPIDMYKLLKPFMFDVVCHSFMGVETKFLQDPDHPYFETGKNVIRILTSNYFSYWMKLQPIFALTSTHREMETAIKNIRNMSDYLISQRQLTLQQNENNSNNNKYTTKEYQKTKTGEAEDVCLLDKFLRTKLTNGDPLPREIINEELSILCFTAHYTTALTMSHAFLFIAKHAEVQKHLIEEQITIFIEDKMKMPTIKDINKMKYLDAVLKETLRLIPTVAKIGRQLKNDLTLKDGRIVPAGSSVVVFYEAIFRNPELFERPDEFYPERFFNPVQPYSFIPFSAGPRNCIGAKYAWLAMKATMSNVLRRFELAESGTEPQIINRMLTESQNGVHLHLKTRVF